MNRTVAIFFAGCFIFICAFVFSCTSAGQRQASRQEEEQGRPARPGADKIGEEKAAAASAPAAATGEAKGAPKEEKGVDEKAGAPSVPATIPRAKKDAPEPTRTPGRNDDFAADGGRVKEGETERTKADIELRRADVTQKGSGLKAGFADDNKQFNYFIDFLEKNKNGVPHYPIDVSERIVLRVTDRGKLPIPNAVVNVYGDGELLFEGKTYSDGTCPFFPSEFSSRIGSYRVKLSHNRNEKEITINRRARREVDIRWDIPRAVGEKVPLDIVFILDTTGSMGEEIERLKRTIEIINLNLITMKARPHVRFGMVLYRDRRDDYVTKVIPLTDNLAQFQEKLDEVEAGGGGDYPEDLQAALDDAMHRIGWSERGVRMAFIITDASAHLDYGQSYTYVRAVKDARKKAVKIFSVGTGGLAIDGEYVLRQISQYTLGKFIFLTYGEKGESEGGREGSVSHHTGANYQTDKLESIIIRFARDEINNIYGKKIEGEEEHFKAVRIDSEKREETLHRLFGMAASQLADYSSIKITRDMPASVLPISPSVPDLKLTSEYFTERLTLSLAKESPFRLVERKNLQAVMRELELGMSGLVNEENAAKVGKLIGAKMLITGKLYRRPDNYELFLQLLRVDTAEVLSVTRAKIDFNLGLSERKNRDGAKKKVKK